MSRESITLASEQMERASKMLVGLESHIPKVVSRAINRAIQNARANVVREVRKRYNVSAKGIRSTLSISGAKPNSLSAVLMSKGPGVRLMEFNVSPSTPNGRRRTPLTVSVKKGEKHRLDRAFIANLNGNKAAERIGSDRLPIRTLYGPSVPQMVNNDQIVKEIAEQARSMLDDRLDHEIKRVLDGAF